MKNLSLRVFLTMTLLAAWLTGRADEAARSFITFDSSYGLGDNSAQVIECTRTGRMVISTIGHVNFYDGDSFAHIDPSADDIMPLPGYNGHYHLYFDKFHHLWVKDRYQVTCVNLRMEHFVRDVAGVIRGMGVEGSVDDLFGDHDNHLWFRQGSKLVSPEYRKTFPVGDHAELLDVDVHDSTLLMQFYADGRLSVFDMKSGCHLYDSPAGTGDDGYQRTAVVRFHGGIYYLIRNGHRGGQLQAYDPERRAWKMLLNTPYSLNNITPYDERLYIPCAYGYWVGDLLGGQWTHVETVTLFGGRQLSTDVNDICFDRQGGMWMGTEKRGLLYARPYASPFRVYRHDEPEAAVLLAAIDAQQKGRAGQLPRRVNCVYRDSRGWTWTGTYSGLQVVKGDTLMLTRKNGFVNDVVHCVVEDDSHNMWVGTSNGISKVWISKGTVDRISNYDRSDNVPVESFGNDRAARLADGTIAMQGVDCIVAFRPGDFHTTEMEQMELYPKLTRLMVDGHEVEPGVEYDGRLILDRAVTRVSEINLNYNQNSLSFTFSGLNYWRPIQTFYRVRVAGIIDEWRVYSYANSRGLVDRRGMFHLPLTGLAPGQYLIELQASMSPDRWETPPYIWSVRVYQPWWRSTGIYILLVAVVLLLVVANFWMLMRNSRLRLQLNNEEGDMMRRIRNFVERCNGMQDDVLTPYALTSSENGAQDADSEREFVAMMLKIVPYVNAHQGSRYGISDLARVAGVATARLYEQMSANLYKSPLRVVLALRVAQAASLLRSTAKSADEIATECGFVSPNFFIASFYRQYRQTPAAYRTSTPR